MRKTRILVLDFYVCSVLSVSFLSSLTLHIQHCIAHQGDRGFEPSQNQIILSYAYVNRMEWVI